MSPIHGQDTVMNVEQRRLELEENVKKLQASLRHWQQWEIEYEGMVSSFLIRTLSSTPFASHVPSSVSLNLTVHGYGSLAGYM